MKSIKKIILWIIVSFLTVIALGAIPSLSCFTAIIIALLIAPIDRWQNFLHKYINGIIKIIAIVVLTILMFATFPISDTPVDADIPRETTTAPTTNSTAVSTTEPTTAPTTEPTTAPTTEPTTAPTTEPTTAPTTEPTAAPTTEPPHTHSFKAATCTTPKTCPCGATKGKANGHSWKAATCISPKTCSSCNATEGTVAGHSWKKATYTSPKTCTGCGATEGNPLDMPGKENYHGHVYTGGEKSTKYHYEADCAGKYSHEITWNEVERRGLGPCGTCVLK